MENYNAYNIDSLNNALPRLGILPEWGTFKVIPSLGNFTQDGYFYPLWATLPRLGNHSQQQAHMFWPKIYPSQNKLPGRAVPSLPGTFLCLPGSSLRSILTILPHT